MSFSTFAIVAHYVLSIFWVALFFSLSIGVHEYGHLLAAFWRGLHVEKFSIGFGPAIKKWNFRGIDYQFSWIPLGGFVALPQLDPSDEPQDSAGRALPNVKPVDRIIVAVAGPLFNILFALLLGTVVWYVGIKGPAEGKSVTIGWVLPERTDDAGKVLGPTPEAAAGLKPGDVLFSVNGTHIARGWAEAHDDLLLLSKTRQITLGIERAGKPQTIAYQAEADPSRENLMFPNYGPRGRVFLTGISPDSPAAAAGLKKDDYVDQINGQPIFATQEFFDAVKHAKESPLVLTIERDKTTQTCTVTPKWMAAEKRFMVGVGIGDEMILVTLHPSPWRQVTDTIKRTFHTVRAATSHENTIGARNFSSFLGIIGGMIKVFNNNFMNGLAFVVLINVSLAILNLLPVPILDGGHVMFALIELVVRRKVHVQVVIYLQYASLALLLTFVAYVSFFDVGRLKHWFLPSHVTGKPLPSFAPTTLAPSTLESLGIVPVSSTDVNALPPSSNAPVATPAATPAAP